MALAEAIEEVVVHPDEGEIATALALSDCLVAKISGAAIRLVVSWAERLIGALATTDTTGDDPAGQMAPWSRCCR